MCSKHQVTLSLLAVVIPLAGQPLSIPWSGYGHDAQHSGVSSVAAQTLGHVKWQTPVDIDLQNTPGELLIHYGSPLVTAANTVSFPFAPALLQIPIASMYSAEWMDLSNTPCLLPGLLRHTIGFPFSALW